ncbi:ZIP family metal transporter [Limnobacter sp.]|uniref:ZIP family metal transporter n=1 Tax=Limnobacter sp. TaxID=2003368 RepID=UPI0035117BD5
MSIQTMTKIVGLNIADRQGAGLFRAARGLLGLLVAFTGLYLLLTQALPAVWAAVEHIMTTPAKLRAVELSAIAGAATGLGGMALLVMRKIDDQGLGLFIAIAAGMMAAAAVISLFLPALQTEGALAVALVASAAGYGLMTMVDQTLPHEHPVAGPAQQAGAERLRMAMLMTIAIGLHNLPEGFAVGASAGAGAAANNGAALSIGLQNIPEGLIVATALWSIGVSKGMAALAALLTGLVEPVGAAVGVVASDAWPMGTPAAMAFAAGAMAFVVFNEMIPESVKMTGKIKTLYTAGVSTVLTALALGWMGA